MVFNLSTGAIISFLAFIPSCIGSIINFYQFFKAKYKYSLYIAMAFIFAALWQAFEGLGVLLITQDIGTALIVSRISIYFIIPMGIFVAMLVDMIDKENVDFWKILLFQ